MPRAKEIKFIEKGMRSSFVGALSSRRKAVLYSSLPLHSGSWHSDCLKCAAVGSGLTHRQVQQIILQESDDRLGQIPAPRLKSSIAERPLVPNLDANAITIGFTASIGPQNSRHFIDNFYWLSAYQAIIKQSSVLRLKEAAAVDSDNFIQLTKVPGDTGYSKTKGAAWVEMPALILDRASALIDWSLHFSCRMVNPDLDAVPGAGLAFVMAKNPSFNMGDSGKDLGYGGLAGRSIALELDTYQDEGDPAYEHIAFVKSSAPPNPVAATQPHLAVTASAMKISGDWIRNYVWLDYIAASKMFRVYWSQVAVKPANHLLQYSFDLKQHFFSPE